MMLWFGAGSASELGAVWPVWCGPCGAARVVWPLLCGSGGFGAATVGVVTAPSRFSGSGEAAWPTPQSGAGHVCQCIEVGNGSNAVVSTVPYAVGEFNMRSWDGSGMGTTVFVKGILGKDQ